MTTMVSLLPQMLETSPITILSTSFTIVLLIIAMLWRKSHAFNHKLPPGPPKLPLIGNLHQLAGAIPHQSLFNLAKKYGPIMHLQLGQVPTIVLSSSEVAKEMLQLKEANFAQRPMTLTSEAMSYNHSSFVFAIYGNYWRQVRKVCATELLNTKQVQAFRTIREEEVWDLIKSISSQEGQTINVSEMIFSESGNIIARAAFGDQRFKDRPEFTSLIEEMVHIAGGFDLPDLFPSFKFLGHITGIQARVRKLQKQVDIVLHDILNEHKMEGGTWSSKNGEPNRENLVDVLLKYRESNELTTDNIKAVILDIFGAGSEPVATIIEWGMAELIKNQRVREKATVEVRQAFKGKTKLEEADVVHANLNYLKWVIKETLRMHPPLALMSRESIERCTIGGYEISPKTKVFTNLYALGRDPSTWEEPNCFKPERFEGLPVDFKGTNFEFIPFGAGRRICPGITFATPYIELALSQMLYHFDWKIPGEMKLEEFDMSESFGLTARKKHRLHLVATTCVPFNK